MAFIGFDFGTTNSLIAQVQASKAVPFLDEENLPTPSVACYEGEQKILGRSAKKRISQAGLGVQGNIVTSPKTLLRQETIFVAGIEKNPTEVVADIVEHILKEAHKNSSRYNFDEISGTVVTIPIDMPGYVRQALRNSFTHAGLRIYQFVHEPFAALYGFFRQNLDAMVRRYNKKKILVVDWGGGTLDLTICIVKNNMLIQLKNDGSDEVGGDNFDEVIMNHILQKFCHVKGIVAPSENPGARARLFDACERAKIDLSAKSSVTIYVPQYFSNLEDNDFECSLNREELECIVEPLLNKAFNRIISILADGGYSTEQVALCLMTGGMASMPAIRSRIHELFGPARTAIPQNTATLVAEGAAWIANDLNGLMLAKTVELEQARGSFVPLVKAGTPMPKEGEIKKINFHMYCTDPRDGFAKFQFCTPYKAGPVLLSDPRKPLADITINVDQKAHAFRERLELDIKINDNLILEIQAASLNENDTDSCEIHELEFGLSFPSATTEEFNKDEGREDLTSEHFASGGNIKVRSNVAMQANLALVPGEFLYSYNPSYFDSRLNPPKEQELERLYYRPCSRCGRRSNDPECTCDHMNQ